MSTRTTPIAALVRGLAAGVIGTAAMTAAQVLPSKLKSSEDTSGGQENSPRDPWEEAPVPALVAKRIAEGVFHKEVSPDLIPVLTNAMHWGYGTTWGAVYGLTHARTSGRPLRNGVMFGVAVWALSYVQLVPMGLYEPPWKYSPKELASDVGYHLAYGAGVGAGHSLISRAGAGALP
jgi:hypothetical protein